MSNDDHDRRREARRLRPFRIELGGRRVERDVDEELAFHLAMRARKLEETGLGSDAARERAIQQFGDVALVKDECVTIDREHHRAINRVHHMQNLRQDIAYALRTLRQNKGFAFVTMLILALGIGANTAIFSLVDVLILRPLPVPHPNELVIVGDPARTGSMNQGSPQSDLASYPLYVDLRDRTKTLSGVYANGRTGRLDVIVPTTGDSLTRGTREPLHPSGRMVSGNYFSVLQIAPAAGRTFAANEGKTPGDAAVVVISYDFWQRSLGGAPSAIGQTLTVNGAPFTIIGVAAQGFTGDLVDRVIDVWLPVTMQASINRNAKYLGDRNTSWLQVMGRLAPGVTVAQAKAEVTAIVMRSMLDNAPAADVAGMRQDFVTQPVRVASGAQGFSFYRSQYTKSLVTLMAAVLLVLLVVCANVANLLLARSTARARELNVRMALGAPRLRLVQQLLTESLVIAIGGGLGGLLIATWASQGLLTLANGGRAGLILDTRPDARILLFSLGVSVLTAMLFGLIPAIRATRIELASALRASGRNLAGGGGRFNAGRVLVVAQVAMSVLLLVGTGMLVRSLQRLDTSDVGADRSRLLIVSVDAEPLGYEGARLKTLLRQLSQSVSTVSGVSGISASENGIFSGTESRTNISVEGFTPRTSDDSTSFYDDVGASYVRTTGGHLLQGRDFSDGDNETGAKVAIVNETFAKRFFPNGNALGHHVTSDSAAREIVGVVGDIVSGDLRGDPKPRFYYPMMQNPEPPSNFYLQIRTSRDPSAMISVVRKALLAPNPQLNIRSIDPLDVLIRDSVRQDRLVAQVVTMFGVLALGLAALGLYGVTAYATLRRRNEFGLRLALGALPGSIILMVLREALSMTVAGLLVGLPLAYFMMQLLRGQLYGVGALDVPSIAVSVVVLALTATVAACVPALRASRVAPLDALRAD